jgi:hypothetical protein
MAPRKLIFAGLMALCAGFAFESAAQAQIRVGITLSATGPAASRRIRHYHGGQEHAQADL